MSFASVLENLLAALIAGLISYLCKRIYRLIKESNIQVHHPKPERKKLRRQFFTFLIILPISTVVFFQIPFGVESVPLLGLKMISGLLAFISFSAVWANFDIAFSFYPTDDDVQKPAKNSAGNHTHNGN